MEHFIVLYGGELDDTGWLDRDAEGRCYAARRAASEFPNATLVFSVDESTPKFEQIRHATLICLKRLGWPTERMIIPAAAHASWGETKAAFDIVQEKRAKEVVVVSSWYHMRRIRFMWWYAGFKGTVIPRFSRETIDPAKSVAHEVGAFAKFLVWIAYKKVRALATGGH